MRLFVAEKPNMGAEIANVLGNPVRKNGYFEVGDSVVTWAFGHILEQLKPDEYDPKYKNWIASDLPIFPQWKLKVSENCKPQFNIIKKLVYLADEIVNAGDPDREGQLLIDEILDFIGNGKPVKRLLLNALDTKSIQTALKNLRNNEDFVGMKNSALARSRADWLVGMNLSRAYSITVRKAGYAEGVPIGRVQTPTMALVVRREAEIERFKSITHYQLHINWLYEHEIIPSVWIPNENNVALDAENRILNPKIVETLLEHINQISNEKNAVVSFMEKKEKTELQRQPYSLSSLQIEAGRRYGYNPQEVLETMQQLYEKKLTTYPRSDCNFLPESQFSEADQILGNIKSLPIDGFADLVKSADFTIKSRAWNDGKISAHHAIIPTTMRCSFKDLTSRQQHLYYMVAQAYLAQFYPKHVYEATVMLIEFDNEIFKATGKVIKTLGWKAIYQKETKYQNDTQENQSLPDISKGELLRYHSGNLVEKVTKPPKRFTEADLVAAMKDIHKYVMDPNMKAQLKSVQGIGTEATRAGIIDGLVKHNFFIVEKKQIKPSEKAKMIIKTLPDELTYPDTTALWEEQLNSIENNALSLTSFHERQKSIIRGFINQAAHAEIAPAKNIVKCPKCKAPMQRRKGAKGFFWGCTNYPECTGVYPDKNGMPVKAVAKGNKRLARFPRI
jgi:DNA topoisomerase III